MTVINVSMLPIQACIPYGYPHSDINEERRAILRINGAGHQESDITAVLASFARLGCCATVN